MGLSENIRQQLINTFKIEQSEHVQKITQGLLALEKNPSVKERQALLDEIFREAHSLKGAARAVGMIAIEGLGHTLEDLLLSAKEGRLTFSTELFDLLYQALDAIELVMEQIEAGNPTPPAKVLALLTRLEETAAKAAGEHPYGYKQESILTGTGRGAEGQRGRGAEGQGGRGAEEQGSKSREEHLEGLADASVPNPQPFDYALRQAQDATQDKPATHRASVRNPQPTGQVSTVPNPQSAFRIPQSAFPNPHSAFRIPQSDETIRVSVSKLDALMAQCSELVGAKIRAEQRLAEVRQLQAFAAEWHKEWTALRSNYSRLTRNGHNGNHNGHGNPAVPHQGKDLVALVDFATHNQDQLRAFNTHSKTLYRQLSNDTMRLSLMIDELQEEIKRVRMLPLSTITTTFGRMVRDLARDQDKQITLTISGGETELDKRVLEQIKDPLIHLLRNAADHGFEATAEREEAGKPAGGRIALSASQQGNNVVITVSDDGRGLDLQTIRQSAVRKGLLSTAEAEKLSRAEAAALIFNSGLSTSKIITDISGRGVGLDVVRQNIEELHGTLEVDFEPGQGTTFTMTLPLTLTSARGLLVRASEQTFALSLATVERMLQVERGAIARVEDKEVIVYQDKPVALAWLADLLELAQSPRDTDQLTIVIVGLAEKRLGLIVDSLAGEQEIVIKSLGKQLVKVGGIAGATVLGSGQVIPVLHTADLVKLAARVQSRTPVTDTNHRETAQRRTIMVVDDSITTRTLEKNILEAAGYEVKLAIDGEEALGTLAPDDLPSLIVSDVNMPHLDGFGLTSRIKQDGRYADIPVILVTSLDSPADKARGIEVGADAYIVKSSFDQGNLLDTIEQLV